MRSTPNWLLSIVFVTIGGIALTSGDSHCSAFDTSDDGWVNTGSRYWYWSGDTSETPDLTPVPAFDATSGYMWFQDQESPPNTGTIVSNSNTITIYPNDEVSISFFRHVINYDGSFRPVLNFVSNGGTYKQNILWTFDVDVWSTVSLLCGEMDEPCCLTYPCTGYLSVDGSILARDEFFAIDDVEINDGCGSGPDPPSPSPADWCCSFDSNVCDWSLEYISNGWHWSKNLPPTDHTVPPATGYYIYEENTAAEVYTTFVTDVSSTATFYVTYYFQTNGVDSTYNNLKFIFRPTSGSPNVVLYTTATNTASWTPLTLATSSATPLCSTSTCSGQFVVESANQPGYEQIAAIDHFSVDEATCPDPPSPSPADWCCNFDSDVCDWSLEYISNGWHWSKNLAPADHTVPPASGYYIYEENTAAEVYTTFVTDVSSTATFYVTYYFQTNGVDSTYNNLKFIFRPTSGSPNVVLYTTATNTASWTPLTLATPSATPLCSTPTCSGQFVVESANQPGYEQIAAIDHFSVDAATC